MTTGGRLKAILVGRHTDLPKEFGNLLPERTGKSPTWEAVPRISFWLMGSISMLFFSAIFQTAATSVGKALAGTYYGKLLMIGCATFGGESGGRLTICLTTFWFWVVWGPDLTCCSSPINKLDESSRPRMITGFRPLNMLKVFGPWGDSKNPNFQGFANAHKNHKAGSRHRKKKRRPPMDLWTRRIYCQTFGQSGCISNRSISCAFEMEPIV